MFRGKPAVFLSCSHKYKELVAWRVRDALQELGILGIVVEDLPRLQQDFSVDDKVDGYLRVADALVALCTPDDQHVDGTWWPRANVLEEVPRARAMPHLQHKVAVLKETTVRLPSNFVCIYERMDFEDLGPAVNALVSQLREWGFDTPDVRLEVPPSVDQLREGAEHAPLLALFELGDEEPNRRRIREWMVAHTKHEQQQALEQVLDILRDTKRWTAAEHAAFVLEYLAVVDLGLFPAKLVDELSRHSDFTVQSVAATILWTAATIAPGSVPLDIVIRLTVEGDDWYVVTPAQRALEQLALSRIDAMYVLMDLAVSRDRDHRVYAAKAFADIANARPRSIPRSVVERLAGELDVEIRDDARRALALMPSEAGIDWRHEFGAFSTL
jgi:hypothetical protein